MRKAQTIKQRIEYAVIMKSQIGAWITRTDCARYAKTTIHNPSITPTLRQLVDDGYLHAIELSQFHPLCRTVVYVRTSKGFTVAPDHQQMALDLVYGD